MENPVVIVYDPKEIAFLASVLATAAETETKMSFRIHPGAYGGVQIKRGESIWTMPFGDVQLS